MCMLINNQSILTSKKCILDRYQSRTSLSAHQQKSIVT